MLNEARKKRAQPFESPPGPPLTKRDLEEIKRIKQIVKGKEPTAREKELALQLMRRQPVLRHEREPASPEKVGDINFRRRDLNQPDQPRQLQIVFSDDWDGGPIEVTGKDAHGRFRGRRNPWVVQPKPGGSVMVNDGNPIREIKSIKNQGAWIDIELWDPEKQTNVTKRHKDRANGTAQAFWRMPAEAPYHREPEKAGEVEEIEGKIEKLSREQASARESGDAERVERIAREIESLMRRQKRVWSGEPPTIRPETSEETTAKLDDAIADATKAYEAAVEADNEAEAEQIQAIVDKLELKKAEVPEEIETTTAVAPPEAGRFAEKTINDFANEINNQRKRFFEVHSAGVDAIEHYMKQKDEAEYARSQDEIPQSEELAEVRAVKEQTEQIVDKASEVKRKYIDKLLDTMVELKAQAKDDWTTFQLIWNSLSGDQRAEYNAEYGKSQFAYERMKRNFDNAQQQVNDLIDAFRQANIRDKQPSASLLLNMVLARMEEQGISPEPGYDQCPECGYEGEFAEIEERAKPSYPALTTKGVIGTITSVKDNIVTIDKGAKDGIEEGMTMAGGVRTPYELPPELQTPEEKEEERGPVPSNWWEQEEYRPRLGSWRRPLPEDKNRKALSEEVDEGDFKVKIISVGNESSAGEIVEGDPSIVRRGSEVHTEVMPTVRRVACPQCEKSFRREEIMKPGVKYDPDILAELQKELKLEYPDHTPVQTTISNVVSKSMQLDTGRKTDRGEPIYETRPTIQIVLDAGVRDGVSRGLDFDIESDGVVFGQAEVVKTGNSKSIAILKNGDPDMVQKGQTIKTMAPLNISGWGDMWIPRWRSNATYMGFEPHRGGSGVEPGKHELEAFSYYIEPYDKREVRGKPGEVYAWKPKPDIAYILVLNYLWNIRAIEVGLLSMSKFARKQPYFSHRPEGQAREKRMGRNIDISRYRNESIQRDCVVCESAPCRCCTQCSAFPCVCEEIQKERIRIMSEFFGDH